MSTHNLTLRYLLSPQGTAIPPEDGWWLTIEQVKDDELLTAGEAAAAIDALFDLTPCKDPIETGEEEAEQPPTDMSAALDKIAEKVPVDLTACERRLTGTYQAQLRIVRSHPDLPYTLRFSVGKVIEAVVTEKTIIVNLDVKSVSSIILPSPVRSGLSCSWQGSVIGPNGSVTPPTIQAKGNTLFWAGICTGTIRAEYQTIEDLVTVEIPGVPNFAGSDRGEPQDATAIAFYHYQAYTADITPPNDDDEDDLAEVCGWGPTVSYELPEGDDPEPPPEPVIEYGCITNGSFPLLWEVDSPEFYEARCCVPGTPPHGNCRVWSSQIEGGKELSEEIKIRMAADWPGPIEFIGLGPITPAGCGTRYEETVIRQKSCCDEVEPMVWDGDTSVEVLTPGTSGIVGVTGGSGNYHWSVRGTDFWLDAAHTQRDGVSDTPYVWIYAGPNSCGIGPIEVTDGCSVITSYVRSTIITLTYRAGPITASAIQHLFPSGWVANGFYGGYPLGAELCRFSADGRFVVSKEHNQYAVLGSIGDPFGYSAAYNTYGLPAPDCLNGWTYTEPISGETFTYFINCMPYGQLNMSHNLNYIYVWQVSC